MKRLLLVPLLAIGASGAHELEARELHVLSSFDSTFVFSQQISNPFMENVTAASDGQITFRVSGPDVIPITEQLEPVAGGIFDILITHAAYHTSDTGIGVAMDAVFVEPELRRSSGLWDFIDDYYREYHGVKLIAIPPLGTKGFHFLVREPITEAPGFQGRRIRGAPTYNNLIEDLGGSPVMIPGGEVYSALDRGVVDGAAWPVVGALDFGWYEVAGYMTRPAFAQSNLFILMNLDSWEALSAEEQETLLSEGRKLESDVIPGFDAAVDEELAELKRRGVEETNFPDEIANQIDELMASGIWELAISISGETAEEMRELARAHNLTY